MSISVAGVSKKFGAFVALDDVSLKVPDGSILALLGPSGSGKTTLLKIIGGLEIPDAGAVYFGDEEMTDRLARERNAGFVFQHYALFRNMHVFDNVAFGLKMRGRPKDEIRDRVAELLQLVGLMGLENRYPSEMSGGQRQRVALARALAAKPQVLLLDEPFGALDATVRTELRRALRRLHDQIHVTTILVTHDQEEAFEISDTVVLMRHGRIEQIGAPLDVYENPCNPFVMDFLGHVNVLPAVAREGRVESGGLYIDCPEYLESTPKPARIYFRSNESDIAPAAIANGARGLRGNVIHVRQAGALMRLHVESSEMDCSIQVDVTRDAYALQPLQRHDAVSIFPQRVRIFIETNGLSVAAIPSAKC